MSDLINNRLEAPESLINQDLIVKNEEKIELVKDFLFHSPC